jgi:predicted RNA-binding Zn ribbon-like protein
MPQAAPRAGHPPSAGAAPGQLETVRGFVNTLDIEQGTDELGTAEGRARWLGTAEPAPPDIRLAIALREALRGILRSHVRPADHVSSARTDLADSAAPAGPVAAVAELRRIAPSLRTGLAVSDDGRVAAAAQGAGPAAALARILLIAAEAGTAGTWSRLKVCSAGDCQWAFYDRSPTRTGCWCSMRICGARAKSKAYRQRTAASQRGAEPRARRLRG